LGRTVHGASIINERANYELGFVGYCLSVLQLYVLSTQLQCAVTDNQKPVHFLANSVIGLSLSIQPPTNIAYSTDFISNPTSLPNNFAQYDLSLFKTFENITITYLPNCTSFVNNTSVTQALSEAKYSARDVSQAIFNLNGTCPNCGNSTWPTDVPLSYANGSCGMGIGVTCLLENPLPQQCRINVRMQAAFILGGCLLVKAIYMIIVNVRARYQTKAQVLTFGDVVVASVLDPNLKVYNECLLNSGDGYRQKVNHTCHKHCKNKTISTSGDEIGHCQKCKKWNIIDKAADLPHPSIAIKYKKSLLSNLGGTVVTQMLILVLTSMGMVALSIVLIISMVNEMKGYENDCAANNPWRYSSIYNSNSFNTYYNCNESLAWNQEQSLGSWGGVAGSVSLGQLPVDSLGSELLAMTISNGSQVLYSLLYLLLVYNMTLISMEQEWGEWEKKRKRPRATLVQGEMFEQSYWLQLPFKVMGPLIAYSALMHWLLGQAISSTETIYSDVVHGVEHSVYKVSVFSVEGQFRKARFELSCKTAFYSE
jgi:hypothetical protein